MCGSKEHQVKDEAQIMCFGNWEDGDAVYSSKVRGACRERYRFVGDGIREGERKKSMQSWWELKGPGNNKQAYRASHWRGRW